MEKNIYIGFDFSMIKSAATFLYDNKITYFCWPAHVCDKSIGLLKSSGVDVINMHREEYTGNSLSEQMEYHTINSIKLADAICDSIREYIKDKEYGNIYIAQEGMSYSSTGNAALQLAGYKYVLMCKLLDIVSIKNIFTYSPISIKSVAGCAKRGMGKEEMINAFVNNNEDTKLNYIMKNNPMSLKKKIHWIETIEDIADSYWNLKTMLKKENI